MSIDGLVCVTPVGPFPTTVLIPLKEQLRAEGLRVSLYFSRCNLPEFTCMALEKLDLPSGYCVKDHTFSGEIT